MLLVALNCSDRYGALQVQALFPRFRAVVSFFAAYASDQPHTTLQGHSHTLVTQFDAPHLDDPLLFEGVSAALFSDHAALVRLQSQALACNQALASLA